MDGKIDVLRGWIAASDNIVFFGGAGVSTESGIPDFRSVDGLYNQQWDYRRRRYSREPSSTGTRRSITASTTRNWWWTA